VASMAKRFGEIKTLNFLSAWFGDSDQLDKFFLDGSGVIYYIYILLTDIIYKQK